jgi:hypothetical protein
VRPERATGLTRDAEATIAKPRGSTAIDNRIAAVEQVNPAASDTTGGRSHASAAERLSCVFAPRAEASSPKPFNESSR